MVNFGLLAAEIVSLVWGPQQISRVSRLGSVTARHSSSRRQPNFAALNRGRHLCLAGRPSRWALAHILVDYCSESITGGETEEEDSERVRNWKTDWEWFVDLLQEPVDSLYTQRQKHTRCMECGSRWLTLGTFTASGNMSEVKRCLTLFCQPLSLWARSGDKAVSVWDQTWREVKLGSFAQIQT